MLGADGPTLMNIASSGSTFTPSFQLLLSGLKPPLQARFCIAGCRQSTPCGMEGAWREQAECIAAGSQAPGTSSNSASCALQPGTAAPNHRAFAHLVSQHQAVDVVACSREGHMFFC